MTGLMSKVVAVVGATGVVGREMLRTLEQRRFPAKRVLALASPRSVGLKIPFNGAELEVQAATPEAFAGVNIALFSAGASASRELAPAAAARGAVVIDNSSAWRMDSEVPLVVPEVNLEAASQRPRDHRQPQLQHDPARGRAQAAPRRGGDQAHRRLDVPGRERQRARGGGGAAGAGARRGGGQKAPAKIFRRRWR